MIMSGGKGTNLYISTIWEGPMKSHDYNLRLVVFDEFGNSFDAGPNKTAFSTFVGKNESRVNGWCPSAFPRRSRLIGFRLFEQGKTNARCLAEFAVTNPAYGNYPTWRPEPFPISKTNGDMSITLVSLKSGLSKADETKVAASNEIAVTQAAYRVMDTNGVSDSWRPNSVEISDATGNQWMVYKESDPPRQQDGNELFSFVGALWPGEVWKLRFEFSRIADFRADETFTFSGIAVPGAKQVVQLQNSTNVAGTKIQLTTLCGEKAKLPGYLEYRAEQGFANFVLSAPQRPEDYRLTLVRITDESGREAKIIPHVDWNPGELVCGFKPPEGAKKLNFAFALQKSRFVEFLVRPEFVRARSPESSRQ